MKLRHPNDLECARQVRRSVQLVRLRLLNPTPKVLESCVPHLRTAVDSLDRLQQHLANPESASLRETRDLRVEMSELRRELAQVNALMQQASAFHAALSNLLAPDDQPVNYAAGGIVPVHPAATMFLEG